MSGLRVIAAALGVALALCGLAVTPAVAGSAGALYIPTAPVRVLDTRDTPGGVLGSGASVSVSLTRRVPANAVAVILNITGTEATESTYVSVYPKGSPRRTVSTLNLVAGQTRANLATVQLGTDLGLTFYNSSGRVHVIADLAGYYVTKTESTSAAAAGFGDLPARRVLDTRTTGALGPAATTTVDFTGIVPTGTTAVAFNLTATDATQSTYLAAWPSDQTRPTASNLNLAPGRPTSNQVVVALSAERKVSFYNHAGTVHALADLAGYYAPGAGHAFHVVSPIRLLDTRPSRGIGAGGVTVVTLSAVIPSDSTAIVANFTGTNTTEDTYITAWPVGRTRPGTSNVNLGRGQTVANMGITGLGPDKDFQIYNNAGYIDVIIDLSGYFDGAQI